MLLTSAVGSLLGSLLVPVLRRYLSEQQLMLYSLVASALAGILVAVLGSLWAQPLLTFVIGLATTAAKPSFDSIAQKNVPPALLGRAFARFETQLQLVWVLCGLLAVAIGFSLQAGDTLLGVTCAVAAGFHVSMSAAPCWRATEPLAPGGPTCPAPRSTDRSGPPSAAAFRPRRHPVACRAP